VEKFKESKENIAKVGNVPGKMKPRASITEA
jgi:hypothetical protein